MKTHLTYAVGELRGIDRVKASYEKGNTIVNYDPEKVNKDQFVKAIHKDRYKYVNIKTKK